MSDTIDDGGPIAASLEVGNDGAMISVGGLSLRDWFAGMALPACFSAPCPAAWAVGSMEHREQSAAASYMMADAMLAARERKEDA